jgi:hypothetical protein
MKSISIVIPALLFLLLSLFISSTSLAQHFVSMTDEQSIELALDMIRKGIQQQDTTKIMKVVSNEVLLKDGTIQLKSNLSRKFQNVFDNSHKRKIQLQKPAFPRADNPLHLSNFWDFDILDPNITIEGDSAVVECELVLWGASAAEGSKHVGKKARERLVFKTPPLEETPYDLDQSQIHYSSNLMKSDKKITRSWKLTKLEVILDFLHEEIALTAQNTD